ncbi:Nuclear pore complex protein NUP155 [Camellia lanceoleosa]|uniref:Nuclear pore complex protein NUP155 n=1 Tax=Camellia lanceoleosa TaxID=1840588 RepID=A0ACC0FWZ1_9ERIC|nr:Nuclear pore complex protein NUP155 [Camellia lanceoleosa]
MSQMSDFANYSGDADSIIVRETWARLIDQALSRGGIAEACAVLKRVGSHVYPGDRAVLPLDTLCLHLEKDALLLSTGAILPSPNLRLRLLRSVLVILCEWAMSVFAQRMNTSDTRASLILGGTFSLEQTAIFNEGVRDKITSAVNRYMTEVQRLALPQRTKQRLSTEVFENLKSRF